MRHDRRLVLAGFLTLLVLTSSNLRGDEVRRVRAWPFPGEERLLVKLASAATDTTLPAPELLEEPPYTWGLENTIHWDGQQISETIAPLGFTLFLFECKASFDGGEMWGFVDAREDSATFTQLPEGITICYRLRYYAQDANGDFARSGWSDPVKSIQDASGPTIATFEIMNLKESGSKKWVNQQTIQIHVVASDPDSGKIMQIAYRESNSDDDHVFKYDVDPPEATIDRVIPYTIYAPEHEFITLSVWVVDVAGQTSSVHSERLFWWEHAEIACFPNPFRPDMGEISTITLDSPDIMKVNVFDPFGNLVRALDRHPSGGFFEWDGRNGRGEGVAKGGYLCVAEGHEKIYCKIAVWR